MVASKKNKTQKTPREWLIRKPRNWAEEDQAIYLMLENHIMPHGYIAGIDEDNGTTIEATIDASEYADESARFAWDKDGRLYTDLFLLYSDDIDSLHTIQMFLWVEDNINTKYVECDQPYRIGWELRDVQDEVLAGPKAGYFPDQPRLKRMPVS